MKISATTMLSLSLTAQRSAAFVARQAAAFRTRTAARAYSGSALRYAEEGQAEVVLVGCGAPNRGTFCSLDCSCDCAQRNAPEVVILSEGCLRACGPSRKWTETEQARSNLTETCRRYLLAHRFSCIGMGWYHAVQMLEKK